MDDVWFRPLVWLDYRLAIIFAVIIPLILFGWSFFKQVDAINCLLTIYWRVASLLMITVYLMIPSWSLGFITGFVARCLIPISLWFWVDLNEEIKDLPPSPLRFLTVSWRWAITLYCSLGILASMPFLSCAFTPGALSGGFCQVWLQPPWRYKELFHANTNPGFLGFLGIVGLVIYGLYFLSFLIFRLGKQGRSALDH